MSSAGLIFKYYGWEIVNTISEKWKIKLNDSEWPDLEADIYSKLFLEVDAIDNGVNQYTSEPLYTIQTGLSSWISRCNPAWFEEGIDQSDWFKLAMDYAEEEFLALLYSKLLVTRPVYEILKKAFDSWFDVHESG